MNTPLVGILMLESELRQAWGSPASSVYSLNLLAAQMSGIEAFLFCLAGVRRNPPLIRGLALGPDGKWERATFPWPSVIYAQGGYPQNQAELRAFRRLVNAAPLVNSKSILPKWLCHHALATSADVAEYLPQMMQLRNPEQVLEMLQQHAGVYIKPDRGSEGRGIHRVRAVEPGLFTWASSTGAQVFHAHTEDQVRQRLRKLAKQTEFVVQAEVPLFRMLDGRRADVRSLVQKNGLGEWVVEYAGLRIGKPGAIITNCFQGGEWLLLDNADEMAGWATADRQKLNTRLTDASLLLVKRLEEALGRMGEIGLDLAFDLQGKVWLLEANAKPDKADIVPTDRPAAKFLRVMEHARYLHQRARSEHETVSRPWVPTDRMDPALARSV